MATFVQLRYTWLISQNVLEVKEGDDFGVFEVKEANENYLLLYNKDKPRDLNQNTVLPLYGDLKFKVADKDNALRFYPFIEQTILASKVDLKAASLTATATPAVTATAAQTSTPSAIKAESLEAVVSTPTTVQTYTAITPDTSLIPRQWIWAVFAIVGIVATGYLVIRRN